MRYAGVLGTVALTELMAHFLSLGWGLMTLLAAFTWVALAGASTAAKSRSTEARVNALIPKVFPNTGGTINGSVTVNGNHTVSGTVSAGTLQGTLSAGYVSGTVASANNANTANNATNANNANTANVANSVSGLSFPQSRPPNPSATLGSLQTSLTDLITALADGNFIN